MKKFYANGKLLITGEYLVLDGAKSLAVPTRKGQSLNFQEKKGQTLSWKSLDSNGEIWFEAMFSSENFNVLESSNTTTANFLQQLLINAKEIKKPSINFSGEVTTKLDFPRNWGFGSSSTLISCVAQWFIIDPFKLHFSISNGSGYDVACANSKSAITYSINNKTPLIHSISWKPSFNESLFFVHLNNKQNSANEVAKYQKQKQDLSLQVDQITKLTDQIISCETLHEFTILIEKHEQIISDITGIPTIKNQLFSDFKGTIKSLGAWGGDFILVIGAEEEKDYFSSKGYSTQLNFDDALIC